MKLCSCGQKHTIMWMETPCTCGKWCAWFSHWIMIGTYGRVCTINSISRAREVHCLSDSGLFTAEQAIMVRSRQDQSNLSGVINCRAGIQAYSSMDSVRRSCNRFTCACNRKELRLLLVLQSRLNIAQQLHPSSIWLFWLASCFSLRSRSQRAGCPQTNSQKQRHCRLPSNSVLT